MRISVCICTVRFATLADAVRSVKRQAFDDWELVVVGQGDEAPLRDATVRAASGDPRIRYVHLNRRGLCAARNAGIAASTGEIIAFTDDDCEAYPDWLATLDECFTPDIGFVCGAVTAPVKSRRIFGLCPEVSPEDVVFDPADGDMAPPGFELMGANFAVRRTDAERVGAFDECLGAGSQFGGGEEHDYAARLAGLGVRMRSTPRCVVQHTHGYRYGIRAVYSMKSSRIRGDGGLAAKRTLLGTRAGEVAVGRSVLDQAKGQLGTVNLVRLPNNAFRLFHYLTSYRECLIGYDLCDTARTDPTTAVLRPLAAAR